MRNYEFFAQTVEREIPAFGRVLRALPSGKLDYKPHEKNKTAGDLAWQVADEMKALAQLFDKGEINMNAQGAHPASSEEIAEEFERAARTVVESARATSEELWKGPGKFLWAGNVAWEATVAELAWGFLFDMIHHRGQLSVYIRPMGGKVPSIYGPSGDDQGGS